MAAVENVFIGASNELGAFESGVAASLLGVGPAVVLGGVLTLGVVAVWPFLFPSLRAIDRFEDVMVGERARGAPELRDRCLGVTDRCSPRSATRRRAPTMTHRRGQPLEWCECVGAAASP